MAKIKVPYLEWRGGRPRWNPGPHLRSRGFKGQDLKDEAGGWLSEAAAIEAARALNAAVRASDAAVAANTPPPARADRSTGALIALFKQSKAFTNTAAKTQSGYRYHLRLIEQWIGDLAVGAVRLQSIEEFYRELEDGKGLATANAVMRTLKRLFYYGVKLEWLTVNRAAKLDMEALEGRLVLWTLEEMRAFEAAAMKLDLMSQADAVLLGAITGQRQGDILSLTASAFDGSTIVLKQQKRKRVVRIPVMLTVRARLAAIAHRNAQRWPKLMTPPAPPNAIAPSRAIRTDAAVLICETTAAPYHPDGSWFRHQFAIVRAAAAKTCPSIADKRWSDLRDTAITWLALAGCTIPEIATITGHSLQTVTTVLDKHYLVRDDALGDSAMAKLETFLTKSGVNALFEGVLMTMESQPNSADEDMQKARKLVDGMAGILAASGKL